MKLILAAMIVASFCAQSIELSAENKLAVIKSCENSSDLIERVFKHGLNGSTQPLVAINNIANDSPETAHSLRFAYLEGVRLGSDEAGVTLEKTAAKAKLICIDLFTYRLESL